MSADSTLPKLDSKTMAAKDRLWNAFRGRCRRAPREGAAAAAARNARMDWWRKARYGMFIHYGLYSVLGRHEWAMNLERWAADDYARLAEGFQPAPGAMRSWARLAAESGMKYAVLTAKHHEGFCLWDTAQTDFNALRLGPKRDLIAEYVEAFRAEGIKVGLYYSLMDWKHPDGAACVFDEAARQRFSAFTYDCVEELMSNYGEICELWYDVPWPLSGAEAWDARRLNRMVRRLQPGIVINDRAWLCEDFYTSEEKITVPAAGRDWECCMTMNGSWGYMPSADDDYCQPREVINRLCRVTAGAGNLLLNIGPAPDGSVPAASARILRQVGRWLQLNGEALYGPVERVSGMEWQATGAWTAAAGDAPNTRCTRYTRYFWCNRWAGEELIFGGVKTPLRRITMQHDGSDVKFSQEPDRVVLRGLPVDCPDPSGCGCVIFKLEFDAPPRQSRGAGCIEIC